MKEGKVKYKYKTNFGFVNPFYRNVQLINHKMFFFRFNRVLQCDMSAQRLLNCSHSANMTQQTFRKHLYSPL